MDEESVDRIRAATNGNDVLGGSRFEAEIAATLKRRVARGKAGRSWSVPYCSWSESPAP
jgi:putative transposase